MRILIRCDASDQMGTGHVMRCLTLANGLRETGNEVAFICRAHVGNLIGRVRSWGFPVHVLPAGSGSPSASEPWLPAHAQWLGASWGEDAEAVSRILESTAGGAVDGLIVDHYGLDAAWESRMRPSVGWIAAIDDLADRMHDCDLLLDQNLYENSERRYLRLVPPDCRMLLGPGYALLREEFIQARSALRRDPGEIRRLLIYFGGNDHGDDTAKVLDALSLADWEGKHADVVVPKGHARAKEIEERCARNPRQTLHRNVERMSEIMALADLAIGAGGTSSWERCCLGLPCLAVCIADNQAELLDVLDARGAVINLGRSSEVTPGSLASAMRELEKRPDGLRKMSETGLSLVDGGGAARVVAALRSLSPPTGVNRGKLRSSTGSLLRPARPGDASLYFIWINDPATRKNSFNSDPIGWPIHYVWFRDRLADPESHLFVLENRDLPVGQIRFLLTGEGAEINFSVAAEFRGRGFGTDLLNMGPIELQKRMARPMVFIGYIKEDNTSSAKAFMAAGFEKSESRQREGDSCLVFRKTISG